MMIIDAHVYSLPARLCDPRVKLPQSEKPIVDAIYAHQDGPSALRLSHQDRIRESMKRSGIGEAVLVALPWVDSRLCRETNDHVLSIAAQYGSFFALCTVQPKEKKCVQEAERCFAAHAIGLKVNPRWQGFDLECPAMDDIAEVTVEHGKVLMVHVDHAFKESVASPGHLYNFAKKHPLTHIIASHMGGGLGLYNLNDDVAATMKRIWFDTAVSSTLEMVRIYSQIGLQDKIIFGSDFPFNHSHEQEQVIRGIRDLGLTSTIEESVFEKNFRTLIRNAEHSGHCKEGPCAL